MKKRTSARRAATFLAMLGVLVMSSGVALMVTANSASATPDPKIVVCKYVSTPGGAYSHVVIPSQSTLPDNFNGTFPFEWTDAQGQSSVGSIAIRYAADGEQAKDVSESECVSSVGDISYTEPTCQSPTTVDFAVADQNKVTISYTGDKVPGGTITVKATAVSPFSFADGSKTFTFPPHTFGPALDPNAPPCAEVSGPAEATASVTFVDPTCANGNVASYSTNGEHVTFDHPTAAAGASITVTATADEGAQFANESTTKTFPHTFTAAADCSTVSPPTTPTTTVSPPKANTPKTSSVTPTVVEAGLTSVSTKDMRGEQGLALMVAGMVMLMGAGGLGLRLRGAASRI